MNANVEWIESDGGPLIFAAKSALLHWFGNKPSAKPDDPTDYERACAVADEIDVISIGHLQALVLGDEPDRTALIERDASDLLVVRWRSADLEESLLSALSAADMGHLPFSRSCTFAAMADEYFLFDSAYPGLEIPRCLNATLQAGNFSVETALFKPDSRICALLHRIRM